MRIIEDRVELTSPYPATTNRIVAIAESPFDQPKEIVRDGREYLSRHYVYPTQGRQIAAVTESYDEYNTEGVLDVNLFRHCGTMTYDAEVRTPKTRVKGRNFVRRIRKLFGEIITESDFHSLKQIYFWLRESKKHAHLIASQGRVENSPLALRMPHIPASPKHRFDKLVEEWRIETEFCSSITDICSHKAYQQIIGMGEVALPFIFGELKKEPGHWQWALSAITGVEVVPKAHRGDLPLMGQDWLTWGRAKGYI